MKTRINVLLVSAGMAAVLATGCVSSKKYKSSQAALQQVRNDSARLAAQVDSLNGNINSLTQRGTALQHSLDSASSSYASQQQKLDYYQNYFTKQSTSITQVSDELKNSLAQAGLTNEDITTDNNIIYVNLDENKVFKKNSTAVSTTGKQALNSLAQVVKSHSDVNVTVSDGNDMNGGTGSAMSSSNNGSSTSGNMSSGRNGNVSSNNGSMSSNNSSTATARRRPAIHHTRSVAKNSTSGSRTDVTRSTTSSSAAKSDNATASATVKKSTPAHKKTTRKYASNEGSMRFAVTGSNASRSRSYALKQGRVNSVANSLLQNGVPKVNLLLQQPSGTQSNSIKVVIAPSMNDFTPQKSTSATTTTQQ